MRIGRTLRHLCAAHWQTRQRFTPAVLSAIEAAIGAAESRHGGEIRFVVETALDLPELWRDLSARQRALQVFGLAGVWDTAHNNGVLIYVLLADRSVEILADRGIAARVPAEEWTRVCREMERHYRAADFGSGSVAGVESVGRILERHFPGGRAHPDELPNQPILL